MDYSHDVDYFHKIMETQNNLFSELLQKRCK